MSKKVSYRKYTKSFGKEDDKRQLDETLDILKNQVDNLTSSVNTITSRGDADTYKGTPGDIKINKIAQNRYEFYIRGEDGWHKDNNASFGPIDEDKDLSDPPTVNMTSGQFNYGYEGNTRLTLNLDPTKISTSAVATPTVKGFGNLKFESTGNTILQSALQMKTVPNASTDPDKFLVLDASDNVKYRTGAQILSDLGIAADEIIDWTADQGSTNIHANNIVITHNEVTDFDSEVNALAQVKIDALVDSAPGALDTLNELAAALNDDANFATTVTNSIATKVGLTGDETVAGHKKFSDDVLIAGTAADTGTNDEVSLGVSGAQFRVHTNHGYVQIGPANTNWAHFYTDRDRYYFDEPVVVDGEYIASYNEDLVLRRVYNDTSYNQITIGDDSFELKLDNTVRLAIDGDGDITTGSWKGSVIASAYLDSDTAHLSGTQTFSGTKTFSNAVTIHTATDAQLNFKTSDDSWAYMQFLQNDGTRRAYIGIDNDLDRLIIAANENGANEIEINTTTVDMNASVDISGNLTVDTNTLFVDSSNNKVGIGTASPDANLQIHSTSGTKLWLTADGSNPADAASLRFAESENGNNYIQLSYDGSANTLSVDSNNHNDLSVWDRVNNRVTHGAQSRFYRAWPQVKFSDDSGTDYVDAGLTTNTFLLKTSDNDVNYQWQNSSSNILMSIDSAEKTVTIGEGPQSTYDFKIGNNGRMNMPVKGLEFENAHGYFASTGDMFLPLFINATQTDLIRFQTPQIIQYWDYSSSAWVDDSSNINNYKNMLDGRRATTYQVSNTKRKFRFVIERASTWADDQLFYIENTWSSITSGLSWNTAAAGGNPITPTMQVERLDGSFDASDDSNNDWTTNSGITTDWHTTGIVTGFGLMMYYSTGMHNSETHIRITVTIPEYADTSKVFSIKNLGVMSSYSSQNTNQQPFIQDFDRNATGYGHINIPSGHEYKINSVSKLSATTLGSGVVNSSLTNLGTLTGLQVSGTIGINSDTGSKLNITNTGDTALMTLTQQSASSGRVTLKLNTNGGDWELGARNNANSLPNAFYIYENDDTSYRFVIADGGNIGIGTTTPSQKLHVIGNVKVDGDVIIDADHKLRSNTDDTWNFIEFDDDSGSPENQTLISSKTNTGVIVDGNNNGTGQFEVLKGGTDGTATELFRIENDGDAVFTGDIYLSGEKKIQFDSTDTTIYTNSDNPEDLYIESDEDMYIRPDDNLVIAHGTTNYVTFKGDEREVDITGDLIVSADLTVDTSTLHVDSTNNNVGIGTTSPSAELHISTASPYPSLLLESTGNTANIMRYTTSDTNWTIGIDYDDNYSIANGANITSARVLTVLKSNGNVGIGTTSPTTTLDVEGTVSYKHVSLTGDSDDLDVSGVTVVECTPSGTNRLGGLTGGVQGQILYILKVDSGFGRIIIEHNEGTGNQDIFLSGGSDVQLSTRGGMTLYCNGTSWFALDK